MDSITNIINNQHNNGRLSEEAESMFLRHQLGETKEYQWAKKLTQRMSRDLQLFLGLSAEMQMISRFSQDKIEPDDRIMLNTAYYANQMVEKGIEGVGINFSFSTSKSEKANESIDREFLLSVNDKLTKCYFNEASTSFEEVMDSKEWGPYTLPNGQMNNQLLVAIVDWLLHRASSPPTKLNTQYWDR